MRKVDVFVRKFVLDVYLLLEVFPNVKTLFEICSNSLQMNKGEDCYRMKIPLDLDNLSRIAFTIFSIHFSSWNKDL